MKKIGLVFADDMEYAPFREKALSLGAEEKTFMGRNSLSFEYGEKLQLVAVECGVGKVNAATATAFLIGTEKVDYIFNAGLSGAIASLKREDMVALNSFVECDFDLTAIGYPLGVKPDGETYIYNADEKLLSYALMSEGVKRASSGTGDIFLSDKERKKLYRERFGIECFDMETAAIASVCHRAEIPLLSLRKISDDADESSVEDYHEMNNRQEKCLTDLLFNIFDRMIMEKDVE